MSQKLNIAVVFGGKSVEHDVSIVSAQIVMENLRKLGKYNVLPIYIDKYGSFQYHDSLQYMETFKDCQKCDFKDFAGYLVELDAKAKGLKITKKKGMFGGSDTLDIDVLFPVMHGMNGEDGTIQGLAEILNCPVTGCGVLGSAVGMDKVMMKDIWKANAIPMVKSLWFMRKDWGNNAAEIYAKIEKELKYPLFVKPANLGSSIGISKAKDRQGLEFAMEVAAHYDRKIIVEEGVTNLVEINCSVLGNDEPISSLLEQPASYEDFLTFEEKYINDGGTMKGIESKVKIPAELDEKMTKEIQAMAVKVYQVLDCAGTSRVDFLVDKDTNKFYANEINTIPGSLQLHLWEASGFSGEEIVDKIIQLALEKYEEKQSFMTLFDSDILKKATGGMKMVKN